MYCFDVARALFAKLAMTSEYQAEDLQVSAQGRATNTKTGVFLTLPHCIRQVPDDNKFDKTSLD